MQSVNNPHGPSGSVAEPLVQELRGGMIENIHYGHICGVDEHGHIRYAAGDPQQTTFMRSAAKPLQALPFFLERLDEKIGFTDEELTIMMASHRSLPYHVEALDGMLRKLGLTEEALVCKPTYPLDTRARDTVVGHGQQQRRIYHNCSGKHLGILAYCQAMGLSLEGYDRPDHPVQRRILQIVAELAECEEADVHLGTDGCGFPVFGLPLQRMAVLYLKLACPDLITDKALARAATRVGELMNAHPDMISADYLTCPNLLRDPNIIAKGGAKGVYCFGLRRERLGFALKIMDGSEEEWPHIIASILTQIGYVDTDTIERLQVVGPKEILNDNKRIVGENRSVFHLKTMR